MTRADRIGAVIDRWYHLGLIRFNSRDDGGDDLILRDELVDAVRSASVLDLSAPETVERLAAACAHWFGFLDAGSEFPPADGDPYTFRDFASALIAALRDRP